TETRGTYGVSSTFPKEKRPNEFGRVQGAVDPTPRHSQQTAGWE
ncbi:hypothetical protein GWI33_000320, partial [Rhynchophorus ferrugineus]